MVTKNAYIVVGLGFGDEGKGLATDFLCLQHPNSIVIRHNGGHQAGHCVTTKDGRKHVFSHLGAGSFRKIPTFWSRFCTFEPCSLVEEINKMDYTPTIYIDYKCLVTTHYDIFFNRALETSMGDKRIGSCGLGYRTTIERQTNLSDKLTFNDILTSKNINEKLNTIEEYYRTKTNLETKFIFDAFQHFEENNKYLIAVDNIKRMISQKIIIPVSENEIFHSEKWDTYIFEGAQGILLDQNFGTKPHITKSNTTSKNALEMISSYTDIDLKKSILYVTRAYQTRHGAGPFRAKNPNFVLKNNESETNLTNDFQGGFRTNFLDINQLEYALKCDNIFSKGIEKNLLITCLDHFNCDEIGVYKNDKETKIDYRKIAKELSFDFKNINYSFSSCAEPLLTQKITTANIL